MFKCGGQSTSAWYSTKGQHPPYQVWSALARRKHSASSCPSCQHQPQLLGKHAKGLPSAFISVSSREARLKPSMLTKRIDEDHALGDARLGGEHRSLDLEWLKVPGSQPWSCRNRIMWTLKPQHSPVYYLTKDITIKDLPMHKLSHNIKNRLATQHICHLTCHHVLVSEESPSELKSLQWSDTENPVTTADNRCIPRTVLSMNKRDNTATPTQGLYDCKAIFV